MSPRRRRFPAGALLAAVVVAAAGAFVGLVVRSQARPEGPVPIVYDKEACAHCHMQIGDPRLAAQAQLQNGAVLNFDDPGCLLVWLEQAPEQPRAIWLRSYREDRWLSRASAAFIDVGETPMGFGLGAVERGTPGAFGWEEAATRVRAKGLERGGS
jgi:hypothetical protein